MMQLRAQFPIFSGKRGSSLTWVELEKLLIEKYADEGMATEIMRFTQARDETPGELGARETKWSD